MIDTQGKVFEFFHQQARSGRSHNVVGFWHPATKRQLMSVGVDKGVYE